MSQIQPVTPARHGSRRWIRPGDFRFAVGTTVVPLAASELQQAALAFPLAFVQREADWSLAALLGLLPGQNLYVDATGKWLGRYIPAALRTYPFLIGAQPNGDATLCVEEASGLLTEAPDAEPFFGEDGSLNPILSQVGTLLMHTAQGEAAMMEACHHLHEAGVLEPWPLTLQTGEGERQVAGLYRMNETALNALDDGPHGVLRRSGALGVAYAQILATGNFAQLVQLGQARMQAEAAARQASAPAKPVLQLPNDSTIDWDWSKVGR